MKKIIFVLSVCLLCIFGGSLSVHATEVTEVYTYEDLLKMKEQPSGSYILMKDIDLLDKEWIPVDFSGVFDGNNHRILNLSVTQTGESTRVTYDGNMKEYDSSFAAFFNTLSNATVKNLHFLNVNTTVTVDVPCFAATIAGFMENSTIDSCSVTGCVTLKAHDRMFGAGGIVGYGNGVISNTQSKMEIITIDTDASTRDEQFLGGAYAAGYIDLEDNIFEMTGYISEHGYVHSGGAVGMYILYPRGLEYAGFINRNKVYGKITFFEDNTNRRAYCKEFIGEVLNWTYEYVGNFAEFEKDERFDYSIDLYPHMCSSQVFQQEVIPSTDTEYGYTRHYCETCGYEYFDHYQLLAKDLQELEEQMKSEKAESEMTEEQEADTQLKQEQTEQNSVDVLMICIGCLVLIIVILFIILVRMTKKMK